MAVIGLDAYAISVRKKRDDRPLRLGRFDGRRDAGEVLHDVLQNEEGRHTDFSFQQRCTYFGDIAKDASAITGRVSVGEYGTTNRVVDAPSGTITYHKRKSDAMMEPFFFSLHLPANKKKGILLTQRTGQRGIKFVLSSALLPGFAERAPGYKLVITPLMPEQALQSLLRRSRLAEVRFIQNIIPADKADRFNKEKTAQEGAVEVILRPMRSGILGMGAIIDFLKKKKTADDLIEIEDFEPDNVKVEIEYSGKRRTIDFGNLGRVKASFDVTDDVEYDDEGWPTLESLKSASDDIHGDLSVLLATIFRH